MKDLMQQLMQAPVVLAVLTDFNANVWYELGIRHSLRKGTIMMIEEGQELPFDIHQYAVLTYQDGLSGMRPLETRLSSFLERIEAESPIDSPVLEFLPPESRLSIAKIGESEIQKLQSVQQQMKQELEEIPTEDAAEKQIRKKVLWVDDHPENNLAIIERYPNITFDLALSTNQAMQYLAETSRYDLVISDMTRGSQLEAGLTLLKQLKKEHPRHPPVIIYASPMTIESSGAKAKDAGAKVITSSPREITAELNQILRVK